MRINVERQKDAETWQSYTVKVGASRAGNNYCNLNGRVFVWKQFREGEPVLEKVDGHWKKVGRITWGDIFLGEGMSHQEWMQTPEGRAVIAQRIQSLRDARKAEVALV
jgi:hypothetical protein